MTWTRAADLRAQVHKLWDKGALLGATLQADTLFPLRLRLAGPSSTELSERFDKVRAWVAELRELEPRFRIERRAFRHRVLGSTAVPQEVWLDTPADALAAIGKLAQAQRFAQLVRHTDDTLAALRPWLQRRPLQALALADAWPRLLAVVAWVQAHPRPGIYLRQVDIAGVDSKFIEAHRAVLSEWLDLALPAQAIDAAASGTSQFGPRYGFRDKPLRIRFRLLDPARALLAAGTDQDITVTQASFERLDPPVQRVFMTENEINFLAFPPVRDAMVVFGAGYGFDVLKGAAWLQQRSLHYWGDIDTHGFAILDQLRAQLPHAQSLLMDRATLMAHAAHWGEEPQPLLRDLPRLTLDEAALYDELRDNRLRPRVRLEQERIGFGWLQQALAALPTCAPDRLHAQPGARPI